MTDVKYHSAWPAIVILVYANLFDSIYYFYVSTLFLEKTKILSVISISCALLNCFLNILLISYYGYIGAAISLLNVQFIQSIIVYHLSKKYRPDIKFNAPKHYLQLIIPAIILTPLLYILVVPIELSIIIKIVIFMIICLIIFIINKNSLVQIIYAQKN